MRTLAVPFRDIENNARRGSIELIASRHFSRNFGKDRLCKRDKSQPVLIDAQFFVIEEYLGHETQGLCDYEHDYKQEHERLRHPGEHQLAVERAHTRAFDPQRHELADEPRVRIEDAHAVAACAAGEMAAAFVAAFDEHFFNRADQPGGAAQRIYLEYIEKDLIAPLLYLFRHLIRKRGGG